MKAKAVIPLVLGLCIGLVAVKFGIDAVRRAKASSTAKTTITAVKATEDIDIGTEITKDMILTVETVPNEFIPAMERVEKVEDVVGRVAEKYIPQNAAVLKSMLSPEGTSAGLVGQIPPGYRAIAVKIDEVTSVAYQIKPGDWVDVGVVMDLQGGRGREKNTIAEVILQRVQVAAVGRSITAPSTKEGSAKGNAAKSVTLLVREEDVPKVQLANTRGSVTLAMRGDDATTMAKTPTASMNEILGGPNPEQPELDRGAAPGPSMVEMIAEAVRAQAATAALSAPPAPPAQPKQPPPPHQVLVYNGRSGAAGLMLEQYTFESNRSRRLIGVTGGPGGASALMAGSRSYDPFAGSEPPQTRTQTQTQTSATAQQPQQQQQPMPWMPFSSMANTVVHEPTQESQNERPDDGSNDDESEAK